MPEKILIIGAGPSGLSSAIFLAKKGFEVTLVERGTKKRNGLKIGESLPPNTRELLIELDLWEQFQASGHLEYYGNKSLWGNAEIAYTDFIQHPVGHGWHIDRCSFEFMLLEKAITLGLEFLEETSIVTAIYEENNWQVQLKNFDKEILNRTYDFLIDATGRNSWLARKFGIERIYEAQQLALVAFLETNKTLEDETSLIETTPDGWWYSTKIPGDRIATAFLCNPDKSKRDLWTKESEWQTLIKEATHTAQRVRESEAKLLAPPRFVAADSSILEEIYGEGWAAVGDAAMAYDPIASHGILMAIVSARDLAKAIEKHLRGDAAALEAYSAVLWAAFQHYAQNRSQFYQAERRFTDSAYWNTVLESH